MKQISLGVKAVYIVVGVFLMSAITLMSATGDLDSTFRAAISGEVQSIAIQPDTRILVGGRMTNVGGVPRNGLVRLYPDGSADHSFDPMKALGLIGTKLIFVDGIQVQADGRILASGWYSRSAGGLAPEIMRFHPDGTIDTSFNAPLSGTLDAFALLPDGKVIVAGSFWVEGVLRRLLRLHADGTIDDGFSTNANGYILALKVDEKGRVYVGGGFMEIGGVNQSHLARLSTDGSLDTSFTPVFGGSVTTLAIRGNGGLIVAVATPSGRFIKGCSAEGVIDSSFSATLASGATINNLVCQANGKVLVSGKFTAVNGSPRRGIARLESNGQVDPSFIVSGSSDEDKGPLALQSDGKILLGGKLANWVGNPSPFIVRLENDAADSSLVLGGSKVLWQVSGTSPVINRADFEFFDHGSGQWMNFGGPVRVGEGWSVDTSGLAATSAIRANGVASSDLNCGVNLREMISFGSATPAVSLIGRDDGELGNGGSLNLGNALSGYYKILPLTIRNAGTGVLSDVTFTFSGAEAADFAVIRWAPTPLGPGETGGFALRYAPQDIGVSSAVLSIASNVGGGPFTLNLAGSGSDILNPHYDTPDDVPLRVGEFAETDKSFGLLTLGFRPEAGTVLTVIDQTQYSIAPARLADLPEKTIVAAEFGGEIFEFIAGYQGRSPYTSESNDLTLTLVGPGVPLISFPASTGEDFDSIAMANSGRMLKLPGFILLDTNGIELEIDPPFFEQGGYQVHLSSLSRGIACPDGTFLVVGRFDTVNGLSRNSLAKFDDNGNFVETFKPDIGSDWVYAVAVQDDGKILVSGGDSFTSVQRLNIDGSKDSGFSVSVDTGVGLLAPLSNGQVLMGGDRLKKVNGLDVDKLVRLNTDGSLDTSFTFSGHQSSGYVGVIAEQADGKIIISDGAGASNERMARILPDGSYDPGFLPDFGGNVGADFDELFIQSDGKIVIGGRFATINGFPRSYMIRLHPDGSLDPSFVSNGGAAKVLVPQTDGEIITNGGVIAGASWAGCVRLRNDFGAMELEIPDASTLRLNVQGSAPLLRGLNVDVLASGSSIWTSLGQAGRTASGWELTGVTLPTSGLVRWRGIPSRQSASNSVIEGYRVLGSARPEIMVQGPRGGELVAGGELDFGSVVFGYDRVVTLRVTNQGDAPWENFGVSFVGANAGDFSLKSMPDHLVLPGETGIIEVVFSPQDVGGRTAALVLTGNDPIRNPLEIDVSGSSGDLLNPEFFTADDVPLVANGFTADGRVFGVPMLGFTAYPGMRLTVVKNTGTAAIEGRFSDLLDGSEVTAYFEGIAYEFIAGYNGNDGNDLILTCLGPGVVDPAFPGSIVPNNQYINFSIPLPDGGTVIGGNFSLVQGVPISNLARLHADGTVDSSFSPNPNGPVWTAHCFQDGSILIGGDFSSVAGITRGNLALIDRDGSLNYQFTPIVDRTVEVLKLQPDGKTLIGGRFGTVNGVVRKFIARLHEDGSLDTSFSPEASSTVSAMALESNGGILIGGSFIRINGQIHNRVARVHADGSVDEEFNPAWGGSSGGGDVEAIHVQRDGKILIGSMFTKVNGAAASHICRLLPSGATDPTFFGGADKIVTAIAQQSDGKILIGGEFLEVGEMPRSRVARLHADGSRDETFNSDIGPYSIGNIAMSSKGAIDLSGLLYSASGVSRNGHARLLNDLPVSNFSMPSSDILLWEPGGAFPLVNTVWFEGYDSSLGDWLALGQASPTASGWTLSGLALPPTGVYRARGMVSSGGVTYQVVSPLGIIGSGSQSLAARSMGERPGGSFSLDFGGIPISWISDREFAIFNDGLKEATNISMSISGVHASDFEVRSEYGEALEPGESFPLVIGFTPSANGSRLAELVISSDGVSPLTIPLRGEGGSLFSPRFSSPHDVPLTGDTVDFAGLSFGRLQLGFAPQAGTVLVAVNQSGNSYFTGPLEGLPDQSQVSAEFEGEIYEFAASYRGGSHNDLAFILLGPGSPDIDFRVDVDGGVTSMARLIDGSVLVSGDFEMVGGVPSHLIGRILPDGTVATDFDLQLSKSAKSMTVQRDGKVIVSAEVKNPASATTGLTRLNVDGSLDGGFSCPLTGSVSAVIELNNGGILIGGDFTLAGGDSRKDLALLHPDGSVDTSFNAMGLTGRYDAVHALLEEADGSILVGGFFSSFDRSGQALLVRVNTSGNLDLGFNAGFSSPNFSFSGVRSLICQPDGKIVVGGELSNIRGSSMRDLIRLNTDGTRDLTFTAVTNAYPAAMYLQHDGSLVIGGPFTSVNGEDRAGLARLFQDGSLDPGFVSNTVLSREALTGRYEGPAARCFVEYGGGQLLVGGSFDSLNGLGERNLGRITPSSLQSAPRLLASTFSWDRPATSTELSEAWFEYSEDSGVSWTLLGTASRTVAGWELSDVSLPISGHVRAGGFSISSNSGSSYVSASELIGRSPTDLEAWREAWFGTSMNISRYADESDFDGDGVANLLEFGFGLNPRVWDTHRFPQWSRTGDVYWIEFERPSGVSGVTFSGQWSETLRENDWHSVENSGSGTSQRFEIARAGRPKLFIRVRVTSP